MPYLQNLRFARTDTSLNWLWLNLCMGKIDYNWIPDSCSPDPIVEWDADHGTQGLQLLYLQKFNVIVISGFDWRCTSSWIWKAAYSSWQKLVEGQAGWSLPSEILSWKVWKGQKSLLPAQQRLSCQCCWKELWGSLPYKLFQQPVLSICHYWLKDSQQISEQFLATCRQDYTWQVFHYTTFKAKASYRNDEVKSRC